MYKNLTLSICIFTLLAAVASPAIGGVDDGLVALFKLDETEGTVAVDASGNGNDGTLLGAGLTWVEGRDAGSLMFTGVDTDGRLEFPTTGMSPSAGSVAVWGYLTDPQPETDGRYFFGHTTQPQFSNRIQLYMQEGTTPSTLLDIGLGSSHTTRTDIVELPLEEWLHVAMTWDNGTYFVYYNGQQISTGSYGGLTALETFANFGNDASSAPYEAFGGMLDDARVYNRALLATEVSTIFHMQPISRFMAKSPSPADGATDVPVDTSPAWAASEFAAAHDVYLGTSFEDVNAASRADPMDVLLSQGQTATSFDPAGLLEYGLTYYWRIDEVNGAPDNTIFKGDIWTFTAEPMGYPIEDVIATTNGVSNEGSGPENVVNGSGLNEADEHSTQATDMWLASPGPDPLWIQFEFDKVYKLYELLVWNYNVQFEPVLGFGVKDVTIEYSVDGTEWAVLGDAQFAKATAIASYVYNTTVDLGGVAARFVRLDINSGYGMLDQYGLSEVRFTYVPVQAREPEPADGATDVDPATDLSWRAGREAVSHDVYLGTDPATVSLIDTTSETTVGADIEFGTTYYWKIDEVSDEVWAGDLWSFSTLEYALIEGFEDYNDDVDAGTTIFDTWIDGWVNDNGSTVGYFDAPFAEQTIVRSGKQSMPLQYDNTVSPFYSEAERTFETARNWTGNGADTLVLYFQGVPGAFAQLSSGDIIIGAAGADIWNAADEFRFVHKQLNGDGAIIARVESVANTNAWAKAGVMIRETLDAGSTFAAVYATPGNGCRYQGRLATDAAAVSDTSVVTAEQTALAAPHWVKIERVGNTFNGYYSTDGENWTAMSWNPQTIAMASNVYIGLAVTSHSAGVLTSAEFSGTGTTGNVTGSWAVETIGPAQPEGNGAGQLYVTLEDAAGKTATAIHPAGEAATFLTGWNEWQIPFSDLTGVNMSRVEVMTIGVGSRANPTADGTGIIYIDDISYGKPAAE